VRLESSLPRAALIGLYWKVIGWLLLLGILLSAYAMACMGLIVTMTSASADASFTATRLADLQGSRLGMVLMGLGYLASILALNVMLRVYLLRDVWVRVLASTRVHGIERGQRARRGLRRRPGCSRILARGPV
jgi:hypothetical protein